MYTDQTSGERVEDGLADKSGFLHRPGVSMNATGLGMLHSFIFFFLECIDPRAETAARS